MVRERSMTNSDFLPPPPIWVGAVPLGVLAPRLNRGSSDWHRHCSPCGSLHRHPRSAAFRAPDDRPRHAVHYRLCGGPSLALRLRLQRLPVGPAAIGPVGTNDPRIAMRARPGVLRMPSASFSGTLPCPSGARATSSGGCRERRPTGGCAQDSNPTLLSASPPCRSSTRCPKALARWRLNERGFHTRIAPGLPHSVEVLFQTGNTRGFPRRPPRPAARLTARSAPRVHPKAPAGLAWLLEQDPENLIRAG